MDQLLSRAKQQGIDECEAYVIEKDSFRAMCNQGEIIDYTSNATRGLGFRGLVNGRMGYSSTEAFDEEAITQLIEGVLESATLCEDDDAVFLYDGVEETPSLNLCTNENISSTEKLEALLKMEKAALEYDNRIAHCSYALFQSGEYTIRIVNSLGLNRCYNESIYAMYIEPNAKVGNEVVSGGFGKAERSFSKLDPIAIATEASKRAVDGLGAKPVPSGQYKVIFHNEAMAQLLSVFCSIFSAESEQKGLSLLKDKLGEVICANCVSIVDNPLLEQGFGSRPFDAEGVPSAVLNVVENGVFKSFLHNLKTANKANVKTTGHASKASYGSSVYVSPSNFGLLGGEISFDSLLMQMSDGLVLTELSGLHAGANAISGDFSLSTKGYIVKNGKREESISQVTVAGNFYTLLKQIVALANDVYYDMDGMFTPSVYAGSLSISGN